MMDHQVCYLITSIYYVVDATIICWRSLFFQKHGQPNGTLIKGQIAPAFTDLSFPIKRQDAANGNGDSPVENRPTNGNWCLGQISTSVLGKTQMLNRADVFTYTFTPKLHNNLGKETSPIEYRLDMHLILDFGFSERLATRE